MGADNVLPELIENRVTPPGSLEALVSKLEYDPCQDNDFFTSNVGGQMEMTCTWLKNQSTDTRKDFCLRPAFFEGKIKEVFRFCPLTCKFDCLQKPAPAVPASFISINRLLEDTSTSPSSTYSPTVTLKGPELKSAAESRAEKRTKSRRKSEKNIKPKTSKETKKNQSRNIKPKTSKETKKNQSKSKSAENTKTKNL